MKTLGCSFLAHLQKSEFSFQESKFPSLNSVCFCINFPLKIRKKKNLSIIFVSHF